MVETEVCSCKFLVELESTAKAKTSMLIVTKIESFLNGREIIKRFDNLMHNQLILTAGVKSNRAHLGSCENYITSSTKYQRATMQSEHVVHNRLIASELSL